MNPLLKSLEPVVVKTGVSLGGLTDEQRRLALAVPAACLPPGVALREAEVNERLRKSLGAEAAFLQTDHVELRRWLVDTGWWTRDGYGREYRRAAPGPGTPEALQAIARGLETEDLAAWSLELRARVAAERAKRRAAWQAGDAGPAADA